MTNKDTEAPTVDNEKQEAPEKKSIRHNIAWCALNVVSIVAIFVSVRYTVLSWVDTLAPKSPSWVQTGNGEYAAVIRTGEPTFYTYMEATAATIGSFVFAAALLAGLIAIVIGIASMVQKVRSSLNQKKSPTTTSPQ